MINISNNGKSKQFIINLTDDYKLGGYLANVDNETTTLDIHDELEHGIKTITGKTSSRLSELINVNGEPPKVGETIKLYENFIEGAISSILGSQTGYTIGSIFYFDYDNGETIFWYQVPTLDNEYGVFLIEDMNYIETPKIQNNIFIDRGINSVYENIHKLTLVKNIRDVETVGFGYFNVNNET